jgi:hypothetical protein
MSDKDDPDERVTLHPLEFEEAMKLLLATPKEKDDEGSPA